jgi:hypothetical protein
VVGAYLRHEGYAVERAADGLHGLERARAGDCAGDWMTHLRTRRACPSVRGYFTMIRSPIVSAS